MPHRTLRSGVQGCQRAFSAIWRRVAAHLLGTGRGDSLGGCFHCRGPARRVQNALRERTEAGCRKRLGGVRQALYLRVGAFDGGDRCARRRKVGMGGRALPAPLLTARLENRVLQSRKHAHQLPPTQVGRETERSKFFASNRRIAIHVRTNGAVLGSQRHSPTARRRGLQSGNYLGKGAAIGGTTRHPHLGHRPDEQPQHEPTRWRNGADVLPPRTELVPTICTTKPLSADTGGAPTQDESRRTDRSQTTGRDERYLWLQRLCQQARLLPDCAPPRREQLSNNLHRQGKIQAFRHARQCEFCL